MPPLSPLPSSHPRTLAAAISITPFFPSERPEHFETTTRRHNPNGSLGRAVRWGGGEGWGINCLEEIPAASKGEVSFVGYSVPFWNHFAAVLPAQFIQFEEGCISGPNPVCLRIPGTRGCSFFPENTQKRRLGARAENAIFPHPCPTLCELTNQLS